MEYRPFYSIIVPLYQAESFICRCLQSVALQTWREWELIIVDNRSMDRGVELVKRWASENPQYKFRLLSESLPGPGAARNAGIRAAMGEWIAFLDADDRWYPSKLQVVTNVITGNRHVDLICHDELAVSATEQPRPLSYHRYYRADIPLFPQLYERNFMSPSAVIVRRSCLLQAGLFDASLLCCEDHDLWIRLARFIRVHFIPAVLGEYLEREGSAIRHVTRAFSCDLRVGQKHFVEFARYTSHPHWGYAYRVLRSYAASARTCLLRGQLLDFMRLTHDVLLMAPRLPRLSE